jgi:hypothetical protein
MNTVRLHVSLLAIAQSIAFLTAALLGERWAIWPTAMSAIVTVSSLWVPKRERAAVTAGVYGAESYRTAAQRAEDTQPAGRPPKPKRRMTHEEYIDAYVNREGWSIVLGIVSVGATGAGTLLYAGASWALVPTIVLVGAVIACIAGFAQCERTVRAWCAQERGDR